MSHSVSFSTTIHLRREMTCLHCWAKFPPEHLLWVSEHRDLFGDPILGEAQQRFLPSRFTIDGNALDARGLTCHEIACPRCHLSLPKSLLEFEPLFVSILGSPSCGKSYYLASMVWSLRKTLPTKFAIRFTDADAVSNQNLIGYEERMFLSETADQRVALSDLIAKTQLQGDLYHSVRHGELTVSYPRPFSFLIQPSGDHPRREVPNSARVLCLYDNAGEHFLPGNDGATTPGTRHLATSSLLLFLYDPTQDRRLDDVIRRANDGQTPYRTRHAGRQEAILSEAAARVRRHLNLPRGEKHSKPLVVVVTKCDVWGSLLDGASLADPWLRGSKSSMHALDHAQIERVSQVTRSFVREHVPEICEEAEAFAEKVFYLPVSALGRAPTFDNQGQAWIRPDEISPTFVAVPVIFGLSLVTRNLIAQATKASPATQRT